MTSILSSISGQFSKSLILSTLLPTAFFVALSLVLVAPMLPSEAVWPTGLEALDVQWKVVVISLVTLALSGALYNLNIPIIRFYEGYPWQESSLGKRWTRQYQAELTAASVRIRGMRTLLRAMAKRLTEDQTVAKQYTEIIGLWKKLWERTESGFPGRVELVLPTRLGNVIRAFEYYPYLQYEMDAVTLWPRLIAKIDKDYAATIDEAKTSFDFMLNSSLLSALLGLALLAVGLLRGTPLTAWSAATIWSVEVTVCAGFSYAFCLAAIGRAGAWGQVVMGAFDLYRSDLLKQLGYSSTVSTQSEERQQWYEISRQMIVGPSPSDPPAIPAAPTYARAVPSSAKLEVARGIKVANNIVTVFLRVRNLESIEVRNLVIGDTLPQGYWLEWNSARADGGFVRCIGVNPYQFLVDRVASGRIVEVTYRAVTLAKAVSQTAQPGA
ncbi:MAG TPA: hypothetical protein VF515_07530 [Candidatus Binatia bacterium]